jgi:hypothetical protein
LPVSASRDDKRCVHPAFRLTALKSEAPPSAFPRKRKFSMSRQLSFALALLACGTMIGATEVFAGPSFRADASGAGTDRPCAARRTGDIDT